MIYKHAFMSSENRRLSVKRLIPLLSVVVVVLFSFGISPVVQFQTKTAEAQGIRTAKLTEEFNSLKTKHGVLPSEWQSELLLQVLLTLTDKSDSVKHQFVDFLEEIGRPSTPALLEMLRDPSDKVRKSAVAALGEIGEHSRKEGWNTDAIAVGLVKALSDPSEQVRHEALEELDDVRPASPKSVAIVVPTLISMRTEGTSSERSDVVDVLGRIGEVLAKNGQPTDAIRDALIASLTDESEEVRENAVDELFDIRAASPETFAALIQAVSDKSSLVRRRAEEALIQLGKQSHATLTPMLAEALESSGSDTSRGHIVNVLGALGEVHAEAGTSVEMFVPPLLIALRDSSNDVRRNAAEELGEMRATQPEVLEALTHALKDPSKAVRNAAQAAIRQIEWEKQNSDSKF